MSEAFFTWAELNNLEPNAKPLAEQRSDGESKPKYSSKFILPKNEDVEIKKYPNRKLYCRGSYISLMEVFLMIRNHCRVQIICAKTHKDLTNFTLKSILIEALRRQNLETQTLMSLVTGLEFPQTSVKNEAEDESPAETKVESENFQTKINLPRFVEWIECEAIQLTLANSNSHAEAARVLGLKRSTLLAKMKRFAMNDEAFVENESPQQFAFDSQIRWGTLL